jgi:sugar lactone lactonase YvrE
VLDTDNHRVQTFNPSFTYQSQFTQQLDLPTGIAVDASGNIYVKDGNTNCAVKKFDGAGNYLLSFGACGPPTGPGIFDNTGGVAVDATGQVWVTSPDFYYVQKYDANGTFVSIVCMGTAACGPVVTPFSVQPFGIAFDAGGNVYVTNVFASGFNVVKLTSGGAYLSSFGSAGSANGQFNYPSAIAIDSTGSIFVADSQNNRVQKFTSAGVYTSQFGTKGTGNGQFSFPVGLTFDPSDNLLVGDTGNQRVQKFDSTGGYLSQFGTKGVGNGQFNAPYGIAIH